MSMPDWKKMALSGVGSAVLLGALLGYFEPSITPGVPYKDVTGIWTNCMGNTHGVDPFMFYTPEVCKGIDDKNMLQDFTELAVYVKVPLSNGQQAAFAGLLHNVGAVKFKSSTLVKEANRGNVKGACAQLLRWVYVGGVKLRGLVRVRQAEYDMCMAGVK